MTINDLLKLLNQIPEDERDNAIYILNHETGTSVPIDKIMPYDKGTKLSQINPLQLEINADKGELE